MEYWQEYEQAIKDAAAAGCMDRDENGNCAPPEGRTCALELNLRDIVKAVKAVRSERMDEYADSIRKNVCMHCINQDEHGDCVYRDHLDCCLDNFMMLVVNAIESVDARHQTPVSESEQA
jgi:hypothetical protein